jgi:hypothetical protein
VIANAGYDELVFYSARGERERAVGQEGDGPGEFGSIVSVHVVADSVWVFDQNPARISVYSRNGELGRVLPLGALSIDGGVRAIGVIAGGYVLVARNDGVFAPAPGPATLFERVYLSRGDGSTPVDVGRFFRTESYWQVAGENLMDAGIPFGPTGVFGTAESQWLYTEGREYRVNRYDADGRLTAAYVFDDVPPPVNSADLEALIDRALEGQERPHPWETRIRLVPLPERMPSYADLRIDPAGNIWALVHGGASPGNCWHVFQTDPPLFALTCLPTGLEVLDVGVDAVLGVERDSLDTERIVLRPILRIGA